MAKGGNEEFRWRNRGVKQTESLEHLIKIPVLQNIQLSKKKMLAFCFGIPTSKRLRLISIFSYRFAIYD
jgi:hypothetical protein